MQKFESIHALAYFNLLKTSSWIEEQLKVALKPIGLTHAQLNVLHVLSVTKPEPVSALDLKKQIIVANPDLTRLLDRLVKKNWVMRSTCPANRRKIDISITDEGEHIFHAAQAALERVLGGFFEEKITEAEAAELRRILHKIRD